MEWLRSKPMAGAAFLGFMLAAMVGSGAVPPVAQGGETGGQIDVSDVEPEDCRRCRNRGWIKCPECHGRGFTYKAKIECPKCHGKGWIKCTKCNDDGLVRCEECRPRRIDGKKVYVIINPRWKEWDKEYGAKAASAFDRSRLDDVPPEPDKYVKCPYCNGEGYIRCPDCNGTKKMICPKCEGRGWIEGRGPCPACHGTKQVPCPDCASCEGVPEKTVGALETLMEKGLIEREEYYKRRRLLTAQAKHRREMLEAQKQAAKPGETAEASREAASDPLAERKKQLKTLVEAVGAKALSLDLYRKKLRELGLPSNVIRDMESQGSKESEALRKYVELKKAFRRGEMDVQAYKEARDQL